MKDAIVNILLIIIASIVVAVVVLFIIYYPVIDRLTHLCQYYPDIFIDCKK